MSTAIEYTDTFGGEANYCWVHRWYCREELSDAQAVRLAKRLCDLTGHRCRKEEYGETTALYPQGMCRVVFITYAEEGYEAGKRVNTDGSPYEEADAS